MLVNLVNNLDRERFDVTVQTLFDVGVNKKELRPYVRYRSFLKKDFRGNTYLFKCFSPGFWWRRIVKEHYDVAVSYLEGPTSRILSGCKDHDTKRIAWVHIELGTAELAAQGFRSIAEAKSAYEGFDEVVAVSKRVRECFAESLDLSRSIEVLYNTNETERIVERSAETPNDPRFVCGEVPTVCSVAKLMTTKGFDRLLDAHKRLLDEGIRHRVYILGIGEEQNALESKIREYGVEDSFVLLGFHENPYKYVARCDLYVCSSRREGFSTAVTEALIVGTPVVSTDCSGAKELLGECDEYGLVVENSTDGIYSGMKKMLVDNNLREHYKKAANERGKHFSREKTAGKAAELLL